MFGIRAFRYACIPDPVPGPVMYFQEKIEERVHVAAHFWLLQGSGHTVLVDTGMGRPPVAEPHRQVFGNFVVEPGEDPLSQLEAAGVRPEAIDLVVLTHLHRDHCLNVDLFPNATIVVSGRGWEAVRRPSHPRLVPDDLFPQRVLAYLSGPARPRLWLALSEEEILPGLSVFWVGGHSPCSQALTVSTEMGNAIITGDVAFYYANLDEDIPVALCTNLAECLIAMDRIRQEADLIVPSHDPELLKRYLGGVVATPPVEESTT